MQISPSSSLLQALSGSSTSQVSTPAARVNRPDNTQAAREAARAVFAQLKTPVPGTPAPATAGSQNQAGVGTPSIPTQAPGRPLPRGSIINILV
jgi:hypothetical protein